MNIYLTEFKAPNPQEPQLRKRGPKKRYTWAGPDIPAESEMAARAILNANGHGYAKIIGVKV